MSPSSKAGLGVRYPGRAGNKVYSRGRKELEEGTGFLGASQVMVKMA